jgi:hypothetical protein
MPTSRKRSASPTPHRFRSSPSREQLQTTIEERVRLVPWPVRTPSSQLKTRNFSIAAASTSKTSFYWPENPQVSAGYTAPLVDWGETRISGLSSQPIVLHGYYSQTYRPEHHNFGESFIFEPLLEEGMPARSSPNSPLPTFNPYVASCELSALLNSGRSASMASFDASLTGHFAWSRFLARRFNEQSPIVRIRSSERLGRRCLGIQMLRGASHCEGRTRGLERVLEAERSSVAGPPCGR